MPVTTDSCGQIRYGIPNNNTEHEALGKIDYNLSTKQTMLIRYMYAVYDNPATFDGSNVLTLSRTGQNNQVHSLVYGHNYILSSNALNSFHFTLQPHAQRSAAAEFFSATDLGSRVSQPAGRIRRRVA